jgi:hypothetical protein
MAAQQKAYAEAEKVSLRGVGAACAVDATNQCTDSCSGYRVTAQEEAEKDFIYHSERAQKRGEAAKFLEQHPEFNQFIELIRTGAISI